MTPPRLPKIAAAAAVLLVALPGFASPASAGDAARLEPLGFSEDGKVFAFEQSGIQDGSGFPYAEIFFLDLAEDRFLPPSPVRIRIEADGAGIADAREQAREAAQALFTTYDPEAHPGSLVVANPPTELSADPYRARFLPRPIEPTPDKPVELRLEPIPLSGGKACEVFGTSYGYRLVRIATKPGDAAVLIHEDTAIPESRGCPLDYALSEIRVYERPTGGFSAVAIIGVKSVGFEGPDLRYIANPLSMD
ncbi:DUF2259 domain-containing protein [Aurantimonas sp. A3-2-R12]|uniref:DUF2259 domain-containing protein n=1 Tax=Aurantimonas sp. A3-2-R12 TaxID=3114362 RepID=UPI002E185F88|nr:DUF2259 domain-containing protein [Aurantimonas sp. A3-2-R12]